MTFQIGKYSASILKPSFPMKNGCDHVVYIKIAKTGSTSVKKYFSQYRNFCMYQHLPYKTPKNLIVIIPLPLVEHAKLYRPELFCNSFILCSIRHPLKRFISAWKYLKQTNNSYVLKKSIDDFLNDDLRYFEWKYKSNYKDIAPSEQWPKISAFVHGFMPQSYFANFIDISQIDMFIPQESMTEKFGFFLREHEVKRDFELYENKTQPRNIKISQNQADQINNIFRKDFQLLGYKSSMPGIY